MTDLVLYSAACQALAAAKNVDEVKDIRDKAEAMRAYAKQAKNKRMEVDAAEIRLRAERRLGELIKLQKETVGLNRGTAGMGRPKLGPSPPEAPKNIQTLAGASVDKLQKETVGLNQGSRSQLKGDIPVGGAVREPPTDTRPTLADAGIDYKLSWRAQKLAAVPDDKFDETLGEWRERIELENERVTISLLLEGVDAENKKKSSVTPMSGDYEWYTPPVYIEAARRVMGSIDLDPASSDKANESVKAEEFYSEEDDGLAYPWHGNVWLNPPYKMPEVENFSAKLYIDYKNGRVKQGILLTHNTTDTKWWHEAAAQAAAICFTRGRIDFINSNNKSATSPRQGQTFMYFGDNAEAFHAEFSLFGMIMSKAK
jgi:phage N-6-adenine-methyltransferase